ncbi:MAG: hypothetical protein ACK4LT_07750 [Aquificaceae bacterium]
MKRISLKLLPFLPSSGGFLYMLSCGCGHCPACLGSSASMVGLALYIGTKKLLKGKSHEKDNSSFVS